jgi:3-methyladenine DNA glycosylase AlkD
MNGDAAKAKVDMLLEELRGRACPENLAGQRRFGITADLGVSIPELRAIARRTGRDHAVALGLWSTGLHEARLLATMVDDPAEVTEEQAEQWVLDLRSWDLCDQWCSNLLDKTPLAWPKAVEWSYREGELVRRAGYVLMATLAVHDKAAGNDAFRALLPRIEAGASDQRHLVSKAVSWALRQIGKRNLPLNAAAIAAAERLKEGDDRASRKVAAEVLRELRGEAVQARLRRRF